MLEFDFRSLVLMAMILGTIAGVQGVTNGDARAQDAFDLTVPKPSEQNSPQLDLECASQSITGKGPGFTDDRDKAEAAAIEDWTNKARKVFPEADFDLSKDENLSCAVQGLFSKCFADGIPCRPKGP